MVVDAAVRSWPPIEPRCLRWTFPIWTPDDSLDPTALRPDRPRRHKKKAEPDKPTEPEWTTKRFTEQFVTDQPMLRQAVIDAATDAGLSQNRAKILLRKAEGAGLVFRWTFGANKPIEFATVPQTTITAKVG